MQNVPGNARGVAKRLTRRWLLQSLALFPVAAAKAETVEFPSRPVNLIVPWPAGGSTDQVARVVARAAEAELGQPIIVLNRPGASTVIGMTEVIRAQPDGYVIGQLSSTTYLTALLRQTPPYQPLNDFSYVYHYADNLIGIVVRADAPWRTLADLVAAGKASSTGLNYGTAGTGSPQHLMVEALNKKAGTGFTHIPMTGTAPAITALLGGHIDFISETSAWMPYVREGKLRPLVVNTPARSHMLPDVPTLGESGFDAFRSVGGIVAPAALPETVRTRLESVFARAAQAPEVLDMMERLSMEPQHNAGPALKALVAEQIRIAQPIIEPFRTAQ
jgi:tripartite-type tricarboxylate transporter receptor subunit TctC